MSFSSPDFVPELPEGSTRRYATRYEPARRDACLAWWEEQPASTDRSLALHDPVIREARHHYALLLDISHTGASIALDQLPDDKTGVWLRLEGEKVTDWTEAEVVGKTTTNRGPHLLRLAFRVPCAFETLRAAVCG